MELRTFKFYGKAFSDTGEVSVVATFNNKEIFSGKIEASTKATPSKLVHETHELFKCEELINIGGKIPFTMTVSSGTVFFGSVFANYSGIEKIGSVVITSPVDFWSKVNENTLESDGKTEVFINEIPQLRQVLNPTEVGDWIYKIDNGSVFSCNIFVDPLRLVYSKI